MPKITPYKIKKGLLYLKHYGFTEFMNRVRDRLEPEEVPYGPWFEAKKPDEAALLAMRNRPVIGGPRISVLVPVYRTPERFLRELIESLLMQTYPNWELILADATEKDAPRKAGEKLPSETAAFYASKDPRVRLVPLSANAGISGNTNAAMAAAEGAYFAFADHDDLLAPQALYRMAEAIVKEGADLLYSDEDKVDTEGTKHYQPHFKPDFNLDLLRSNNYITHLLVVKKSLAEAAGPFRDDMSGAQDYDFIFRCCEKAEKIVHIPEILYHWRTHEASTSDNPMSKQYAYEAGKRAIEEHLARVNCPGRVELLPDFGFYRVRYPVQGRPLVSVIIPSKDASEELEACLDALFSNSYENIEVLVVENNSEKQETFELYRKLTGNPRVRLLRWRKEFNYSAINNYAARAARGEYLLFLNNDVRGTISRGWLTEMLGVCQRPEVGAVGAKLYYPDNTVQHAGIVIGIGGVAGAMFVGLPKGRGGYLHKANIMQDMSACTAACLLVRAEVFRKAGGFEEKLAVAFNDVDLCLKMRELGYLIVYDPYAELYHDESKTRGPEDTPEKVRRFQEEIDYMRIRWKNILKNGDPMYNRNLSLQKWNYSLKP